MAFRIRSRPNLPRIVSEYNSFAILTSQGPACARSLSTTSSCRSVPPSSGLPNNCGFNRTSKATTDPEHISSTISLYSGTTPSYTSRNSAAAALSRQNMATADTTKPREIISLKIAPTDLSLIAWGLMTQHEHSSNVAVVLEYLSMKKLLYAKASSALPGHDSPRPANDEDRMSSFTTAMEFAPRNDMATRGSGRMRNSLGSTFNNSAAASTSSTSPKQIDFKSTNVNPAFSSSMAISPNDS
mmetsp:Transcript_25202/g.45368  ORF Transcript_25202/g.45368 Transcript_25202/m.45368 type:complete len:242 (+) Transcript_25202:183-908(+)